MSVSIIILNYNGKHYLKECIDSVLSQSYRDFEIILVDNGSSDGSIEYVKQQFNDDRLKIFSTGENLGFTGGNNFGFCYANGDYIVLLNNDTVVEKNWLEELINSVKNFENAGLVQSLVLTEGIPDKYYQKNGTVNLLGHNIMEIFGIDMNGNGEIFLASGSSLIFYKNILKQKNEIFPEEYFLYSEDTYLSLYSIFSGRRNYHTSKSVVHHKGSGTTKKEKTSIITFYQERNRILNFLIFFNFYILIRLIPYFFLNFLLKLVLSLISNRYSFKGILKSYFWILSNPGTIKSRRREIKKIKIAKDRDVLLFLSCKLFNGNNIFEIIVNNISKTYCLITGLRTVEFIKK
ncbi:MAG: glycosyltransferase family 2 protein [Ignavibacteria bacterium]|nr:glycosyltransferase family 2 protein [Ignavibacteria bacterium]